MSVTGQAETDGSGFLPEEDTIEYRLYSLEEDESLLAKLAVECSQLTQQITREHIWHYDRFSLEVCAGKRGERPWKFLNPTIRVNNRIYSDHAHECRIWPADSLPACLYGRSCFRDNVEDEWLIVYLLYSISRLYTNLVIRSVHAMVSNCLNAAASIVSHPAKCNANAGAQVVCGPSIFLQNDTFTVVLTFICDTISRLCRLSSGKLQLLAYPAIILHN